MPANVTQHISVALQDGVIGLDASVTSVDR
jgi:hypothetical protein